MAVACSRDRLPVVPAGARMLDSTHVHLTNGILVAGCVVKRSHGYQQERAVDAGAMRLRPRFVSSRARLALPAPSAWAGAPPAGAQPQSGTQQGVRRLA